MLIMIPAFLEMCECSQHGHFKFADGTSGTEFCSKEGARYELRKLSSNRRITEHELTFLKHCVSNVLSLPQADDDAGILVHLTCDLYNEGGLDEKIAQEGPSRYVN